ncbi:MAG TPA: CPCC family cysteine-rich protein [Thermoanaerobaculia bacterium]
MANDTDHPRLAPCPCCSYRTLERRGDYDICPVCFWEDDGSDDPQRYSSPNHMTLEEGRANFARYGACSPEHVKHVDPDGPRKYSR